MYDRKKICSAQNVTDVSFFVVLLLVLYISDRGVYKVHVNTRHCACVYTINELAPKLV